MREEDIPADMEELANQYRDHMLESISDEDEEIMMRYLEGEDIPEKMIKTAIRKATIANKIIPVTCGSSYKNKGCLLYTSSRSTASSSAASSPTTNAIA